MKKQPLATKLHKSVHPTLGKIVLGAGILLVAIALVLVFQQQSVSPTLTNQSTLTPTSTPIPSLNPTYFLLTPTPTLAPGQKAIYTFYIQASSHKSSQELVLSPSDTGKEFTVDIGTLIILEHFGVINIHISQFSHQAIFENFGSPETIHLPNNALGAFRIYREGLGTITVVEKD